MPCRCHEFMNEDQRLNIGQSAGRAKRFFFLLKNCYEIQQFRIFDFVYTIHFGGKNEKEQNNGCAVHLRCVVIIGAKCTGRIRNWRVSDCKQITLDSLGALDVKAPSRFKQRTSPFAFVDSAYVQLQVRKCDEYISLRTMFAESRASRLQKNRAKNWLSTSMQRIRISQLTHHFTCAYWIF